MPTTTTTNPHPVDSRTRTCCGGIGGHAQDCAITDGITAPAGASRIGQWVDTPNGLAQKRGFTSDAVLVFEQSRWLALRTVGFQFVYDDGHLFVVRTTELVANDQSTGIHLLPGQARALAAALVNAADELDALTT